MAERGHLLGRHQPSATYGQDYAAWVSEQVMLLRAGRTDELDVANLAEEVGDLGKSDYRGLVSAIRTILIHMLKWDHQAERRSRSWTASIYENRDVVAEELEASPSYRTRLEEAVATAYRRARRRAAAETDLPLQTFPETCPYDWDEITSREHPLDGEA